MRVRFRRAGDKVRISIDDKKRGGRYTHTTVADLFDGLADLPGETIIPGAPADITVTSTRGGYHFQIGPCYATVTAADLVTRLEKAAADG